MLNIFVCDSAIENPSVSDVGILEHYEFNANLQWSAIERYTIDALNNAIIPFIGLPFYNALAEKVNNDTALLQEEKDTLFFLRRAVAYYAATIFIPLKVTNTTSAGMVSNDSERVTTSTLGEVKFSLWQTTLQADKHLDNLLGYMEKGLLIAGITPDSETAAFFDLWKNDEAYTLATSPFFRHTVSFQKYYNIFSSRPTFLALLPHINDICEDVIAPILCGDLYEELTTALQTGEGLTEENTTLIHHIRRAIAPLAVAKAAPVLALVTEGSGFKVVSSTEGMNKHEAAVKQHQAQIAALVARCQSDGEDKLNKLRKFLIDNLDKYPLYADSPCYRATLPRKKAFGVQVVTDKDNRGAFIFKNR